MRSGLGLKRAAILVAGKVHHRSRGTHPIIPRLATLAARAQFPAAAMATATRGRRWRSNRRASALCSVIAHERPPPRLVELSE